MNGVSACIRALAAAPIALALGCGSLPATTETGTVLVIAIDEHVSPEVLIASPGDEIRWRNLGGKPVRIGLLGNQGVDQVSCQHGFMRLGQLQEFVTIEPGDFASLCFARTGIVQYNVWMDADDLRGSMSPTATIRVERSS
jgi:hypothetical protein